MSEPDHDRADLMRRMGLPESAEDWTPEDAGRARAYMREMQVERFRLNNRISDLDACIKSVDRVIERLTAFHETATT